MIDLRQVSVSSACAHAFDAATQKRGDAYAGEGRLDDLHIEAAGSWGDMRGSGRKRYLVGVDVVVIEQSLVVVLECECPMGRGGIACKHMWALLRTLEGATDQRLDGDRLVVVTSGHGVVPHVPAGMSTASAARMYRELIDDEGGPDRPPPPPPRPSWSSPISSIGYEASRDYVPRPLAAFATPGRIEYLIDATATKPIRDGLSIFLGRRKANKRGLGTLRAVDLCMDDLPTLVDPADREICALLLSTYSSIDHYSYNPYARRTSSIEVATHSLAEVMPKLVATGRLGVLHDRRGAKTPFEPLRWDEGEAYVPRLSLQAAEGGASYNVELTLEREADRVGAHEVTGVPGRDVVAVGDRLVRLVPGYAGAAWLSHYLTAGALTVRANELPAFLDKLAEHSAAPLLDLPGEHIVEQARAPAAYIRFEAPTGKGKVRGSVAFAYGAARVSADDLRLMIPAGEASAVLVRRNFEMEREAVHLLAGHEVSVDKKGVVSVPPSEFPALVGTLVEAGWHIEADGSVLRSASEMSSRVTSGIDWFDVQLAANFDGVAAPMPALLEALRNQSGFVELGDGSRGLLPAAWLQQYGALVAAGRASKDGVRFGANQAAVLDVLLALSPETDVDEVFATARDRLRAISRVGPREAPAGFRGDLRSYQRDGLGWLSLLRELGLGGCLADDMGLGKTIQVLALIAGRPKGSGPVLIVAPRSVVHNWIDEAARFVPDLAVMEYSGSGRRVQRERFDEVDVIVTTYGTIRRDAAVLAKRTFDTVVLDEAQAIKNRTSQAARSCRALQAHHRLALTGTPVENSLDDLASLFEFLNPGMLGRSDVLSKLASTESPDADGLSVLARALRPFMLRRTKTQVLDDLPDKTEQILVCTLSPSQRRQYDALRKHYQAELAKQVEKRGLSGSKIHVLEALLRLRQVACHPALVDKELGGERSAKVETLVERLVSVAQTGHKALVFSQFTSLLAIVRDRLDQEGITYEYLDGRTRNRKEKVDRFQADEACPVFLISLKAGGSGLNLTAADYVFLLDPWWNPAVEAQAIDRAHRIGQTRGVMAYRLIAENTVEDKILLLQQDKRDLADGIFAENSGVFSQMTAEDLSLLLS